MRAIALAIAGVIAFHASSFGQLMSGDTWLKHCMAPQDPHAHGFNLYFEGVNFGYCFGYIEGVIDAIGAGHELVAGHTFCIPPGTTAAQMQAVTLNYLREHPDLRNYSAAAIVPDALEQAFPCR